MCMDMPCATSQGTPWRCREEMRRVCTGTRVHYEQTVRGQRARPRRSASHGRPSLSSLPSHNDGWYITNRTNVTTRTAIDPLSRVLQTSLTTLGERRSNP